MFVRVSTTDSDGTPNTIDTTPGHYFFVKEANDFIPAIELPQGATLITSDGASVYVQEVRATRGPPNWDGTTYNLTIADWHTYFVGDRGVWVHNEGAACQRLFGIYTRYRERDGLDAWGGWKRMLQRMDATTTAEKWAEPALNGAAELVMREMYKEATAGGVVNLSKVAKWSEMDTVMAGRRVIPGLEAHHVVPIDNLRSLGIPEARWNDVPGLLIDQWKHRRNNQPNNLSFHHILREKMAGVEDRMNLDQVIAALRSAYSEFGMDDAGAVAEAWLRSPPSP